MKKWQGLMGLCARAGRAKFGSEAAVAAVRGGTARLALVDGGASENTQKMFRDACDHHRVPLRVVPAGELGACTGRDGCMAAAVVDEGFAAHIVSLLDTENTH